MELSKKCDDIPLAPKVRKEIQLKKIIDRKNTKQQQEKEEYDDEIHVKIFEIKSLDSFLVFHFI